LLTGFDICWLFFNHQFPWLYYALKAKRLVHGFGIGLQIFGAYYDLADC